MEKITQFSYKTIVGKLPKGDPRLSELAGNWERCPTGPTVDMLLNLIKQGFVVAPGVYTNNYKNKANFERGQLVLMDFDDGVITWEEAKTHPFFKQHCLAAHTSCSHGIDGAEKFHVIALLPKPVADAESYDNAVKALRQHLPGQDAAMTADQCCYGNPNAEWIYFNNSNRLPELKLEQPKRDAFAEMVKLSTDDEPHESKVRKMKLCLQFIPERIDGQGTYNEAFDAACVLFNEFGVDEGFKIADECNWLGTWDLYRKLESIEGDNSQRPKRLGSLIEKVRELHSAGGRYEDKERSEEFEIRLNQINCSQSSLATSSELLRDGKTNGQKIQEILERVVELQLDITKNTWSERQALMKQMQALGPSKAECKQRVFEHICAYFGVDLGATEAQEFEDQGRASFRSLLGQSRTPWLIPGYLHQKRDAVFFGDSGSGKTTIALDMVRCKTQLRTFADATKPCSPSGKTLFIASDGGCNAGSILASYIEQLGCGYSEQFWDNFTWWSQKPDSSSPPWTLTLGNMVRLKKRLEKGDIDLVVIDSLKAVTAGTDYSIDDRNIGEVMRLMQSIVSPYAALVWIHHTNKSGSKSSHSAGGVTDIIEVVSAAFQVQREWVDGQAEQTSTMKVQKLRGEDSRQFEFEFDWLGGVKPLTDYDSAARELEARKTAIPESILVAIRDSEFGRKSRGTLAEELKVSANTLDNYTQELKKQGLIKQARQKGWMLTKQGEEAADNLSRKRLEALSNITGDF